MKALVLESEKGRTVALREDGEVVTVAGVWTVGERMDLPEAKVLPFPRKKRRWVQAVVAASLALVVLTGSYTYTTAWACSYVSLETEEASVELAVNRLGQVIEVKALDENSTRLAESLTQELQRKPVTEAVDLAVERFREDGRVAAEEPVVAGVTDENEQRAARLTEEIGRGEELQAVEVSPEQRREARKQNMGGGRFVWEQRAAPEEPADPAAREEPAEENSLPEEPEGEEIPEAEPEQPGVNAPREQEEPGQHGPSREEPSEDPPERSEESAPRQPDREEQPPEEVSREAGMPPQGEVPGRVDHGAGDGPAEGKGLV